VGLSQNRLVRQFFTSMPAGAQACLYLGVFFCFAPIGLLVSAASLQVTPVGEIVLVTLFSGVVAVVYAATAIRDPRWLPIPVVAHVGLSLALARLTPERALPLVLDAAAIAAVTGRLHVIAALIVASLAGAFICFFTLIQREGLRFSVAHAEIRLAREIHATLVPDIVGRTARLEWRGVSRPSGDVGGDLVDVVTEGPAWTAVVADVSGHGVAAGVLMGMFKTAFRAATMDGQEIGLLMTKVNAVISPLRQANMFVTAACLRVTDGSLQYVLAGHPPILHLPASTGRAAWVGASQLAVGLIDPTAYTEGTLAVAPGDVIVVLTDGLLEVFDRRDRQLGPEGLQRAAERAGPGAPLDAIETALLDACRAHGPQSDDQTLLVLRVC
jgi:hypothetical protein